MSGPNKMEIFHPRGFIRVKNSTDKLFLVLISQTVKSTRTSWQVLLAFSALGTSGGVVVVVRPSKFRGYSWSISFLKISEFLSNTRVGHRQKNTLGIVYPNH